MSISKSSPPALHSLVLFFSFGLSTVVCLVLIHFLLTSTIFAQSEVVRNSTVTATVPDNSPPTVPVLISPTNNSYQTTSRPAFIWEASTDANGIGSYKMSLDGIDYLTNIPTTNTDNPSYTLTYDSINSRYTLTPKSDISNGVHTWKIRADDTLGNGTDSATWTFTIDTQAPAFVISQIGNQAVSISAQDVSTVPNDPIELDENEPLLSGSGEASSTVQLTLTIPGDPTQNFTITITTGGNWSQQLGILPRDVIMTMDFTITDVAGNISVLTGVQFIIPADEIIIPPVSPSPSPSPSATPSATPDSTPTPPTTPSPPASPASPPASPLLVIPVIPPREIINEVSQESTEFFAPLVELTLSQLPKNVQIIIEDTAETVAPVSNLIIAGAIPAVTTVAVATQFGGNLSLAVIIKILQALGLLPAGKPQGLVFDAATSEPVPFALLTITNKTSANTQILETAVTDVNGIYQGVKLSPDAYEISVSHQDFRFPTQKPRPQLLTLYDFYRGETFTVTSQTQEQLFMIPMDANTENGNRSRKIQIKLALAKLNRLMAKLVLPLFMISGLLAILFPSFWNWLMFGIYSYLIFSKARAWFKTPILTGTIIDTHGQPLANALVRFTKTETNTVISVVTTNEKGDFALYGEFGVYQVAVSKPGYVWYENESSTLSFHEKRLTSGTEQMVITLTSTEEIYQQLFS